MIVFPKKNKHITFDGSKRHGVSLVFEEDKINDPRYIIAINLWNKKPSDVEYYQKTQIEKEYNDDVQVVNIKPCDETKNIIIHQNQKYF